MKTTYKKINRIKDILGINGNTLVASYNNFDNDISKISLDNKDLDTQIIRFLKKSKDEIISDLKNNKFVKVKSCMGIYTMFLASEENAEEFFILSPYLESYISVEDYQEMLAKQNIIITDEIISILFSVGVITKKKFNYLLELISEQEDIDYLNAVAIYTDNSVKNSKKVTNKKYHIRELLNNRGKFSKDIYEAVYNGDVTKIAMIYDLKIKEIGQAAFELGFSRTKEQRYFLNDVLYSALSQSEANSLDVDVMWIKVKNKLDNDDFSENIVRGYSILVDKEKYKDKQPVVRNCIAYINEHIREKINLDNISSELDVNKSYLSSVFNREMGYSIVDYIHEKRISNAQYLLKNTDFSISEIADYIGYFDTSYFIRIFKSLVKSTPLKYRENSRYL
ncbi:AraC family transcriptional regulator [Gemella sp. zg-570]|uniref:helix-turn-helix transcriptional regulator n=1 Tax=Gemella sp. zg-570 TaxID=2840371 RepID=UPI001C0ACC7A|nr:AraC family transcriptional regulator [Gemella sp. zg-570]QWQ38866.1 AraC family transcriptional regulator [Gemella sp. zg-570]